MPFDSARLSRYGKSLGSIPNESVLSGALSLVTADMTDRKDGHLTQRSNPHPGVFSKTCAFFAGTLLERNHAPFL